MKKKYLVFLILGISILFLTIFYNKEVKVKNDNTEVKIENSEKESNSKEDVDVGEKEAIAKRLFNEYLEGISTKKEGENTVKLLNNYRIEKVTFIEGDDNNYTVDICYDIQTTDEGKNLRAGDGMVVEDNWILQKSNFVDIEGNGTVYAIKKVYQG